MQKRYPPKPPSILFTQQGYDELVAKKENLEKSRPAAVEDLAKARAMGDLSENGYYKSARAKLSDVDRELRHLTYLIKNAKIKEKVASDTVDVGVTVTITDGQNDRTYAIVGGYESNPSEGKISHHSPLGKALLGKRVGEKAYVTTPAKTVTYTIQNIS